MSTTRQHRRSIELPAPPEQVFSILITPSAICKWWQASRAIVLAKPDGFWAATWGAEHDPDYISAAKIKVFDPPRRLVLSDYQYLAKTGPLPFEADFTTEFIIEPKNGGSLLTVVQDGFPTDPIADEFYAGCDVGWKNTLAGIRNYLTSNM